MSCEQQCPKDSPLMVAWDAYKSTDEYKNSLSWATRYIPEDNTEFIERARASGANPVTRTDKEKYVEGSLWAAFMAGFLARYPSEDQSPMTLSPRAIKAAARAIIKARQEWRDREGPFGVYYLPYSIAGQHAVRDFRPGAEAKIVSRFDTHEEAMAECALLTEQHFLAAALAVGGLCLVPKEPTEDMLDYGACYEDPFSLYKNYPIFNEGDISRDVYRAMIDAASTGDSPRQREG